MLMAEPTKCGEKPLHEVCRTEPDSESPMWCELRYASQDVFQSTAIVIESKVSEDKLIFLLNIFCFAKS